MSGLFNHIALPIRISGVIAIALLLFAVALAAWRRHSRTSENINTSKGEVAMSKVTSQQINPRRLVTRGESIARRTVERLEGNLESHKHNVDKAAKLRREGREQEAKREMQIVRKQYARRAVELVSEVGIDGGASFYGIIRLNPLDSQRANAWLRRRIADLSALMPAASADRPLRFDKAVLYRITGGPRSGDSYDLYLFHKASVEHYTKMLEEARDYLQHGREKDARDLLCRERDRCVMLSFAPGQVVEPM